MTKQQNSLLNYRIQYPHPEQVLSILYGSLLGEAYIEKRISNVRICLEQENTNVEYLMWLWSQLSGYGYCTNIKPIVKTRPGRGGIRRSLYRFRTFTSSTLNYLYNEWYRNGTSEIKRVPLNIENNLTQQAIACWAQSDGCLVGGGFKFNTYSFPFEDLQLLVHALFYRYHIQASIHSAGSINKWVLYIKVDNMPTFRNIVKPYFVESMYYKLGL